MRVKRWRALLAALLMTLTAAGCGQSGAKKAAGEFLTAFYRVDAQDAARCRALSAPTTAEGLQTASAKLHARFQPLMTEAGFESLVSGRQYLTIARRAVQQGETVEAQNVRLSGMENDGDVRQYSYTVTLKVRQNGRETTAQQSGTVGLSAADGWKVVSLTESGSPAF